MSGTIPSGTIPSGTIPSGSAPSGSAPSGSAPSGTAPEQPLSTPQTHPKEWLTDSNGEIALSVRVKGAALFVEQSPYQKVEVFDTYRCGKLLAIDSMVMCNEWDEAAYHEMITHVPMQCRTQPVKDVLVIGAGDGGTIRELMRYPEIERVTMVEIDDAVVRASKQWLPSISCAFGDARLDLKIEDGIQFVQNAPDQAYDLVVIDSSDPVGPSEGLFSASFYRDVFRCLRPGGRISVQSESPSFNPKAFRELNHCLKGIFGAGSVHAYLLFIPTYPTGLWSLTYCSKQGSHPVQDLDEGRSHAFTQEHQLRYYNPGVHRAAFCLPNYIHQMIA